MKMALQKYIAESGVCSRRKAEELIRESVKTRHGAFITVNGKPAELGMMVDADDDVRINGKRIMPAPEKIYIMLNKPKGYTCTNRKFKDEKNVFDLLTSPPALSLKQGEGARLFVVGRLDKDSRGLVILTNDGEMAQKVTHPRYEHEKIYNARINTNSERIDTNAIITSLLLGVDIGEGDGIVRAKEAKYLGFDKDAKIYKYSIVLTEGKKRQIRRMFKALGCEVKDLVRVQIGNLKLGDLPEGKWRRLDQKEIAPLLH